MGSTSRRRRRFPLYRPNQKIDDRRRRRFQDLGLRQSDQNIVGLTTLLRARVSQDLSFPVRSHFFADIFDLINEHDLVNTIDFSKYTRFEARSSIFAGISNLGWDLRIELTSQIWAEIPDLSRDNRFVLSSQIWVKISSLGRDLGWDRIFGFGTSLLFTESATCKFTAGVQGTQSLAGVWERSPQQKNVWVSFVDGHERKSQKIFSFSLQVDFRLVRESFLVISGWTMNRFWLIYGWSVNRFWLF